MIETLQSLNTVAIAIIATIVTIFLLSIVMLIIIKRRYHTLIKDLGNKENRNNGVFASRMLNNLVEEYKSLIESTSAEINSAALVDKNYYTNFRFLIAGEKFLSRSVSLMIVLGLLGTFYGLTLSIGEMVSLLADTAASELGNVESITSGLISSISGMSVAFVTSLFGIASSVILTVLMIIVNIDSSKESFLVHADEYLDNNFKRKTDIDMNIERLSHAFEGFSGSMDTSFNDIANNISYKLGVSTSEMAKAAEAIQGSINTFNESIQQFTENTRDFSEFNYHLKTNIQRMSVTFDDLTTSLTKNNEELRELTKDVKEK